MATQVRLELDSAGFQALLNSSEVVALVHEAAAGVASRAGDGFEVVEFQGTFGGSPRPMATVTAATRDAREAEAVGGVLSAAVRGGGG